MKWIRVPRWVRRVLTCSRAFASYGRDRDPVLAMTVPALKTTCGGQTGTAYTLEMRSLDIVPPHPRGNETRWKIAAHCAVVRDGAEAIVLNKEAGMYFGLNHTAAVLFDALCERGTAAQLIAALTSRFSIEPETAAQDVSRVIEEWCGLGLIVPCDT